MGVLFNFSAHVVSVFIAMKMGMLKVQLFVITASRRSGYDSGFASGYPERVYKLPNKKVETNK